MVDHHCKWGILIFELLIERDSPSELYGDSWYVSQQQDKVSQKTPVSSGMFLTLG